jgi:hypothetical protein
VILAPGAKKNLVTPLLMGTKVLVLVMEAVNVFCAVRTQYLYNMKLVLLRLAYYRKYPIR